MSRTFGETVAFLNNLEDLVWFLSLVCVMVTILRSWNRNKAGAGLAVVWLCQEQLSINYFDLNI